MFARLERAGLQSRDPKIGRLFKQHGDNCARERAAGDRPDGELGHAWHAPRRWLQTCPEVGEPRRPAAIDLRATFRSIVAEPFEIAMLEANARPAIAGIGKADLDFGQETGLVSPVAAELPAEDQPVGRIPCDDRAPLGLIAILIDLVPPTAVMRLDNDIHGGRGSRRASAGPPSQPMSAVNS